MTFKSRVCIAACLTISVSATFAAVAERHAPAERLVQTTPAPVVETAEWFHLSFDPVRETEATPIIKSGVELSRPGTDSAQPSQPAIQVPAAVQNLRRTDR